MSLCLQIIHTMIRDEVSRVELRTTTDWMGSAANALFQIKSNQTYF